MKSTLTLAAMCVIVFAIIFNATQFQTASRITEWREQVNSDVQLLVHNHQQLQTLNFVVAVDGEGWREKAQSIIDTTEFKFTPPKNPNITQANDWPEIESLEAQIQRLSPLKKAMASTTFANQSQQQALTSVATWLPDLLGLLQKLQEGKRNLERNLSSELRKHWRFTTFVTVTLLPLLLVIAYALIAAQKRDQHNEYSNQLVGADLKNRQEDFMRHQEVMTSLLEDMKHERNRAMDLAQENQRKHREMEQFIYTVSHDLRSPLVAIAGFTRRLKMHLTDASLMKSVERIQYNINNMEALLNELMNLSKIVYESVDKVRLDLQQLVEDVIEEMREQKPGVDIELKCQESLLDIDANQRLIRQCLHNLFANAVQYRDPQRPLRIEVFTEEADQETIVSVKDNGIGIDEKYHQRIFRVFERLSEGQGFGVGLAIVKMVMEKHGGRVMLQSTPGVGSTFLLYFPIVETSGSS